ncbi:MAG: hypothetical protein Q8P41_07340 [Pseudomonadota bacterium]|nr:hypothetical protein [Pseudomonadota bacterium]
MPSQSVRSLATSAAATSAVASERSPTSGRGNAATADRVEAEATSRAPADYAVKGTPVEHAPAEAGHAVNAGESATAERQTGEREVRILHAEDDPLRVSEATPASDDLYEERPLAEVCDPSWQAVGGVRGSVAAPMRSESLVEGSLFVGGAPSVMDVHQGQVGDCYLMAGLIGLVAADPGRVADMIQVSGGSAVVSFFRHDDAADAWVPTAITVNLDLAHRFDANDGPRLNGAGFRRSDQPVRSEWYAQAPFDDLWVCEDAYYEAAMWVPLIEKAYARFAERYGQYGGFAPRRANEATDGQGNARSGYEIIEAGFTQPVLRVLLGEGAGALPAADVEWSPGQANVEANERAVLRLLGQRGDGAVAGEKTVMTVGITETKSIERLGAQLAFLLGEKDVQQYPDFERALRRLDGAIGDWSKATDGPDKDALEAGVTRAARTMVAPGTWPILRSDRGGGEYRALDELLLIVANLGDDEGSGQRHVYARHEYVVMNSTFRDATGAALAVTNANLPMMLPLIDAARSAVNLRNPHGTNSPAPTGTADVTQDDGAFVVTLDQFFRSFDSQQSVALK